MKFLLVSLLLIGACSKAPNQKNLVNLPQAEIEMAPSTINLTVVDSVLTGALSNLETEIALGDVEAGTKISKRIILSAKTEIPALNIDGFRNASIFLFKYSNCSTLLKRLRSCVIDIEFTPATSGPLSEIIALSQDLSFQLTANIIPKPVVIPTYPNLLVPESLNLGDFVGIKKTARVTISNKSSVPQELIPDFSALAGTNFAYVSYCPVSPIKLFANRSCQIDFSYISTEELSADQVVTATVSMNSKPIAVSVTHKATAQAQDEGFVWLTPSIVLGDVSTTRKQIVYVKNGTSKDQINLAFSTLPSGVSVLRTNCYASLRISRSCYVELQFSPTQMYDGAFSYQYDYFNSTILARLNITANVIGGISLSAPCTLADAESNRWDITNASLASGNKVGTDVSACMVSTCNQNFSPDSFNKTCVPNIIACASGVGSGTKTWNGSAYDQCLVDACPTNYEILANACSPIACTLLNANIANVLTVSGELVSGCSVQSCQPEYEIGSSNNCQGSPCGIENAATNGLSSIVGVATVSGTINDDSCFVTACEQYYQAATDNKSCLAKLCSELSAGELSSLGYNLTGATISGSYNSCTLECSSSLQELATGGKSCVDKSPTGLIAFAQSTTNSTTGNTLNITANNAQQIQFYSDSICSTTSGSAYSMPMSSLDITVSAGYGVKNIYAKLINGSQSSACLNASITYEAAACTLSNADSYGVTLLHVSSVIGLAPNCAVSACDEGYTTSQDAKSCSFSPATFIKHKGFNAQIVAVVIQADGKKIYGGSFTSFTNSAGVTFVTNRIARINADGSLDETFTSNIGSGFNNNVNALALDSAGNLYVGGFFTTFKGTANSARYIAKLSATGVLDTTFMNNLDVVSGTKATTSGFNNNVNALALDSAGNLYVGGSFSMVKGTASSANRIAKLSSTGLLDTTFMNNLDVVSGTKATTSGFNSSVNALALDSSGNLYVGGGFTTFKGIASSANRIAKLSATGVLDTTFMNNLDVVSGTKATTSGFNNNVLTLSVDSSNNLYVGGSFSAFKGIANSAKNIAKLSSIGVLDATFMDNLDVISGTKATTSGFNNNVNALALDSAGNLYVGGGFTTFKGIANSANRIAKLSSTGLLDTTFMNNLDVVSGTKDSTSGFNNIVYALSVDSSNNLYVGGSFTSFKNTSANYNLKLSSTGVALPYISSSASFNGFILSIVLDSSGNTYVGGNFTSYNGVTTNRLAKFDPYGNLDVSFASEIGAGFDGNVLALTFDSAGNLYVGGGFTTFKGIANSANRIAKLSSTGLLDTTFMNNLDVVSGTKATTSGFDNSVQALTFDSAGNLYVGGNFTSLKGIANSARYIAKLSATGVLDTTFMDNLDVISGTKATTSGFNSNVPALTFDSADNLYVGGSFTSFKGVANSAKNIAKLSTTGVLDTTFMDNLDVISGTKATTSGFNNSVSKLTLDSVGNLYVGGGFTTFKGIANSARYIAKLSTAGVLDATFMDNLDVISGTKATTSGFNNSVIELTLDSVGNLYVGGYFTTVKGTADSARCIAKLSTTGLLDTTFMNNLDVVSGTKAITSGFDNYVNSVALDSAGNLYVGGGFTAFKGTANSSILFLLNDGTEP